MLVDQYLADIRECSDEVDISAILNDMSFDGVELVKKGNLKEGVPLLKAVLSFDRGNDLYWPAIKEAEEVLWNLGELKRPSLEAFIARIREELPKMDDYSTELAVAKAIAKHPREYPQGPEKAIEILKKLHSQRPLDKKSERLLYMLSMGKG